MQACITIRHCANDLVILNKGMFCASNVKFILIASVVIMYK